MKVIDPHIGLHMCNNMNEDSMMYVSIDEYLLTMKVIDEFLSTPEATRPPVIAASHLDGDDNTLSSFIKSIPDAMNNTAVQTNGVGPSKINPIKDNCCFAIEQMSVWSSTSNYSTIIDCQHSTSTLLSTGEPKSPPQISFCSLSLPVIDHMEKDHTEESLSRQNMNSIPPQFQFSQQRQQQYANIIIPDIDNITLPQQWPSKPSNISNELPDGTSSTADLMTILPGSLSAAQTNSLRTIASNNQQSQNIANSNKLVPGTSLVVGVQVDSIQTINSLGQKNTNLMEKLIKCDVTEDGKAFKGQQVLEEHKILNTANKLFECNICHKKFTRKRSLEGHCFTHTGQKPFECNVCGKKYIQKGNLSVHYLTHTGEKPFECNICHKKFTRKRSLEGHCFTHTGQKPFECNVCGKKYRQKSNLSVHYLTHTDQKPFECNICGKKYRQKSNLSVHYLTHTGQKPFECNTCGKKYRQKIHLNMHNLTHTGKKPFECNICHKTFTQKHSLEGHCFTHAGQKPFEFNVCGKKYRQKRTLNRHHCNVHCTSEEPFKFN